MNRFSIITPTFNSAAHISRCVESVLSQQFADFEHIIIDNKSTDATVQLAKELYASAGKSDVLKIFSEQDSGISDAFNKGIAHASGEYLLILNSDDHLADVETLSRIDACIRKTGALIIHADMLFIDEMFGTNRRAPLFCSFQAAFPYNHPGMFIHKSLYAQYGVYKLQYRVAMDYELLLRFSIYVDDFNAKIHYFSDAPVTVCHAGGISWQMEQRGINEVRQALIEHGMFNAAGMYHYYIRTIRTKVKRVLQVLHLESLVKWWRKRKWGN